MVEGIYLDEGKACRGAYRQDFSFWKINVFYDLNLHIQARSTDRLHSCERGGERPMLWNPTVPRSQQFWSCKCQPSLPCGHHPCWEGGCGSEGHPHLQSSAEDCFPEYIHHPQRSQCTAWFRYSHSVAKFCLFLPPQCTAVSLVNIELSCV